MESTMMSQEQRFTETRLLFKAESGHGSGSGKREQSWDNQGRDDHKGRDKDHGGHDRDDDDYFDHGHHGGNGHGCDGGGNTKQAKASVADLTVIEGGFALVTITLDHAVRNTVQVSYGTSNGTARAGSDYGAVCGSVTIRAGQTSVVVKVPITADSLDEANETFRFNLTKVTGAQMGDSSAIITILDDDAPKFCGNLRGLTNEDAAPFVIDLLQGVRDGNGDHPWVAEPAVLTRADGIVLDYQLVGSQFVIDPAQFNDLDAGTSETVVLHYRVTDGSGSAPRTLTLKVEGRNDAPTAADIVATVSEDGPLLLVPLAGHDIDRNASLTYAVLGQPEAGQVIANGDGTFSFDPAGAFEELQVGESRQVSFAYSVTDEHGASAQAIATIVVEGVNDAPDAVDDASATLRNQVRTILASDLLKNDTDVEGDGLTVIGVGNGIGGTAALDADGNVLFTPEAGFVGDASFQYTISDGHGGFDSATVFVKVLTTLGNAAPIAMDDFLLGTCGDDVLIDGDGPSTLVGGGGHDTLIGGGGDDTLIINGDDVVQGDDGIDTVVVVGDNPVTVDMGQSGVESVIGGNGADTIVTGPGDDFVHGGGGDDVIVAGPGNDIINGGSGDDTVVLTGSASDYEFDWIPGGLVITAPDGSSTTITGTELADFGDMDVEFGPDMRPICFRVHEDQSVVIPKGLLLRNDTDADGDPLTIVSAQDGVNATITLLANGDIRFQGLPDYNGLATFTYTISDGHGGFDTATVTVKVWPVNDLPVLGADSFVTDEDTAISIAVADLLVNDTDVDGDALSVYSVGNGQGGSVALVDGHVVFTPDANFNGDASFDYTVSDSHGGKVMRTVIVAVNAVNDAPVAGGEALATEADTPLTVSVNSLLSNDHDAEGDALSLIAVGNATHGTATFNAAGEVTFTPEAGFVGEASFTYTVSDGLGGSGTATVTVMVKPSDDFTPAELVVNSFTAGEQTSPAVAELASGEHVVVWQSNLQDGSGWGIYAQRLDERGAKIGAEFQVNTSIANDQMAPTVAALAGGGFVVAWSSSLQDGSAEGIFLQRYDALGGKLGGEIPANSTISGSQYRPRITSLRDGGFLVTWESAGQDGSGYGCYAQRYTANGIPDGGEFRINATFAGDQWGPQVTGLVDGGWVAVWHSNGQDGSKYGVVAQRYGADGVKIGGEVLVNTFTAGDQAWSAVTGLADGGWVVTWQCGLQQSSWEIYAQVFNADGTRRGGELHVNTYTNDIQEAAAITALTDGGFMVAWESSNQDGSGFGCYGQRFDHSGAPMGGEFRLSTTTASDQRLPALAGRSDGGFIVAWQSNGQDGSGNAIVAKTYARPASLVEAAELVVNSFTAGEQTSPAVAELASGEHVVVWQSNLQDGSGWGIYAQRLDERGAKIGAEFQVNTSITNDQMAPTVAALAGGGFVVAWSSSLQDGSAEGIFLQRYDALGGKLGGEIPANSTISGSQYRPRITSLRDGGFLVTWESAGQDGSGYGCYAQRYDANGIPDGGEFRINATFAGDQWGPQVTGLVDGGWVAVWHSNGQDGSKYGVVAQRYGADGVKIGGEVLVNTFTAGDQAWSAVTGLADGGWVVTWQCGLQQSSWEIYAQVFNADGTRRGGELHVNTYTNDIQEAAAITALTDGGFMVAWESSNQDGSGFGCYGQRFDHSGAPMGGEFRLSTTTASDQRLPALAGRSDGGFIVAWQSNGQDGSGNAIVAKTYAVTGDGDDLVANTSGSDRLVGGAGADIFVVGRSSGEDIINNRGHGSDGDVVLFGAGVAADQLWFERLGDNLKVSIIGTSDSVTVEAWYSAPINVVSAIATADGFQLLDGQVDNLVSVMAGFNPPPLGQTQLTVQQHQVLDLVIAVNWQAH
jgi:hypothetical protein